MSKEKVLVLFGDSLTDYFPMELFKDVEAQVYNRGEAGNTVPEMAARAEMDVVSLRPDLVLMQGGANDYLLPFYRGAEVIAGQLLRTAERILEKAVNSEIERLCGEKEIPYVDVYRELIGEDGELPLSYTVDGVHLSREGYKQVWKVLSQVLTAEKFLR